MSDPQVLCDLDAEKALLGTMLMRAEAIDDVLAIVKPEAFYLEPHSTLYAALIELHNAGKPMDVIAVNEHLRRHGTYDRIGGQEYMVELCESFGDLANAEHYARQVRDKWVRRRLWSIGTALARRACDELNEPDVDAILGDVWREAEEVVASGQDHEVEAVDDIVARMPEWLRTDYRRVLPTGFDAIDRRIDGFPRPGYVILAARPSVGKTSLGLAFGLNVVKSARTPVLFVSLETPRMRIAGRVFAMDTGESLQTWRQGPPQSLDNTAGSFRRRFEQAKLYVADTLFGIGQIIARARQMIRAKKVGLIVIDYLQLVGGDKKAENRNLEIQAISRTLRILANKQGVTVLALCQLNREAVSGQRPGLHHLRESGAIEQDADVVMFIYHGGHASQVCIDVAKNRDGPLGSWTAEFRGDLFRFTIQDGLHHDHGSTSGPMYPADDDADGGPF